MNKSVEGLQANVERLQAYKSKLVVFKNDKEAVGATQFCGEKVAPKVEFMEVTPEMKKHSAFMGIRQARSDARNYGRRLKRASQAEEEN